MGLTTMENNIHNLSLYRRLKQLKSAIQDLNQAREQLKLSQAELEDSNKKLAESVKSLNVQVAQLRKIAAESEILEKWITSGDYSNPPTLTASILASKKLQ